MEQIISLLKEFGFPIGLSIVLLYAIWKQNAIVQKSNAALVALQTERINTLEAIITALTKKVDSLEKDRIQRADEYSLSLKDIAGRYASAVREQNQISRQSMTVLAQLIDAIKIRPCQLDSFTPTPVVPPRAPSAHDLPKVSELETEKIEL